LANDVYAHLARAIEVQLADLQSRDADPTTVESTAHRIFAEDRRRLFIGRTDVLRVIEDHLRRPSAHPLVVHGAAGSGKSTVMARALAVVDPAAALVYRFIGVTPASSLLPALLEGLCAELARFEGIARSGTAVADVSQLSTEFRGRLATVGAQRPLVVFLDALDQLSAAHGARALNWLPLDLPATVHFVVSAADGAVLETLMQLVPADHRCEVRPMPVSDGSALLDAWLADAKRALQPAQRAAVLRSFQVQRLPLHLRLAFEEARRWPSDHTPPRLPADVPGLVRSLFARLSLDANHGAHLVTRSVAFIVAGRYGVGEEEMLDLLSVDAQVMRELRRRSPDSPRTDTMPGVVWSRLYFDLVPYLTEHAAAGGTTLGFFHRQLAEVVSHDLLAGRAGKQRHSALVRYFRDQPDQRVASDAASPNLRKFDEWPFQLAYAGRWGDLARLFTTFAFLRAKIESLGPLAVIEDFDVAREAGGDIPGAAAFRRGRGYLGALQDAVRLSAAVLGNDPKMLASQILGRLRGLHRELSPLVRDAERFAHRPWLNPLTASLGRPGGPLNQAIVLDRAIVAVHFVDEDHVIVGCEDGTLRLIDLQQGGERWRVPAHACDLVGLTYDQRMRRAVTIASDGSVGVWSIDVPKRELSFNVDFKPRCVGIAPGGAWMAIGGERRTAKSPYYEGIASVRSCSSGDELAQVLESHPLRTIAVTADGRSFIGGSSSGHIRQWNAAAAGLMNDFRTHDGMIGSIAIADEADRLLIGSGDQSSGQYNLRLWHLSEWRELDIFKGHRWMIHSVAITPDGRVGASAAIDTTVRIWDFEAKRQIVCFRGHARRDGALTMTPDGHRIVSSSASSLYEWAVERQVAPRSFLRHEESVTAIAASADSRYALSCSNDDVSALWNLRTCRARRLDALTGEAPSAVAMDRKGRFGLVGTKAGALLRVDLRRAVVKRAAQLDEQPTAMALTANGRVAAVGCSRGTIRLIDLDRGTELRRFGDHSDKVTGVAFAQGERRVISGSGDFFLYAWDPLTGRLLRRHSNGSGVPVLAASADGRRAVSGTHFGQLFVWDVERMRRIASFAHQTIGQNSMVVAAAITPDGRYALSGGNDLELRVWDLVCKRCIATFMVEDFSYCAAAAGNNVFVVGSRNGAVHILRIERGKSLSARGPAGEARWRASPPRLSEVVFGNRG
jgi:WD40 repeat protein